MYSIQSTYSDDEKNSGSAIQALHLRSSLMLSFQACLEPAFRFRNALFDTLPLLCPTGWGEHSCCSSMPPAPYASNARYVIVW